MVSLVAKEENAQTPHSPPLDPPHGYAEIVRSPLYSRTLPLRTRSSPAVKFNYFGKILLRWKMMHKNRTISASRERCSSVAFAKIEYKANNCRKPVKGIQRGRVRRLSTRPLCRRTNVERRNFIYAVHISMPLRMNARKSNSQTKSTIDRRQIMLYNT